ncbi:hypothetical protein CK203_086670 [Vitis vinifera]|uniref:Uncharacterized protein n=1 Tax=Vitis vinifera TaxID=29760 RepID=A0A438EER1_VITVI|nr:hypothetical protein CK203_086670 [Vitis vinifera]
MMCIRESLSCAPFSLPPPEAPLVLLPLMMASYAFSSNFSPFVWDYSCKIRLWGELKTPTGVRLAFDEKTPTQNSNPDNVGSSMVLTVAKKPNSQSFDKASAGADSNEMSLSKVSELPEQGEEHWSGAMDLKDNGDIDGNNIDTHEASAKKVPVAHMELSETNAAMTFGEMKEFTRDAHGLSRSKVIRLPFCHSSLNVFLEENSKDPQHKHLDVPIDSLEEHLGSVAQKDGILTPKNEGNLSQTDETTGFLKDGKSLHHMSMGILQMDETTTPMAVALSPSQFTWSGHKCCSITSQQKIPEMGHWLEKKLLASPEYQGSLSRDLKQQDQHNKFSFGSGQDGSTIENFAITSHSSATANKLDSPHLERRGQSSTPFIEIKHSKEFSQDMDTLNHQSPSPEKNLQTGEESTRLRMNFLAYRLLRPISLQMSMVVVIAIRTPHFTNAIFQQDVENSPGQKRRSEELVLKDVDMNLSVFRGVQKFIKIFSKFSEDTKQILSPLIDNLNLRAISLLEDILLDLQKVRAHEMFFLKSNLRQAKLTRRLVIRRVQLLSSGIQESQMLKMNSFQCLSLPGARDAQVDDGGHQSCSVNFEGKIEDAYDKVSAMRQEIEASDRKIKNLTKSLQSSCKTKGKPSCAETILLVTDHLNRRTCCRFIRQDLQFWEVDEFENRNYPHSFVLCYRDAILLPLTSHYHFYYLLMLLVVLGGDGKSAGSDDGANGIFLMKFMQLYKVLPIGSTLGPRQLLSPWHILFMQMTSSLLSNLLDVVEEVQLARLELRNLSKTSFHSPSGFPPSILPGLKELGSDELDA